MVVKVKVEGLKELDAALGELPKATGKNVLRRVLREVAKPMADQAAGMAPVLTGTLKRSVGVGSRLTKRQGRLHRKMFKDDKASVEIFVGAGGLPQAHLREFGADGKPPHAFVRPAWDANKMPMLERIKSTLAAEIKKSADRLARKAAKG